MRAVLSQKGHPIAFFSKQFCPKLLHALTCFRELLTITTTIKKWRQYLLGHPFIILTDHRSLKELMAQIVQTLEQQKYLSRLMGYNFTIQYISDCLNVVADALSHISKVSKGTVFLLSMPHFMFLVELKRELVDHLKFIALRRDLQDRPENHPDHTYTNGLILQNGHIWLPSNFNIIPFDPHRWSYGDHKDIGQIAGKFYMEFYQE